MRRLLRWAFNGAAAMSAVLCVATCVLWVYVARGPRTFYELLDVGVINLSVSQKYLVYEGPPQTINSWRIGSNGLAPLPGPTILLISFWKIVAATFPLPAAVAILRKRNNRKPGLCPSCGYDLRATPDRCPECGAVPKAKGAT